MNPTYHASLRRSLALGALLLLTTAVTGCGVGLPTQPDIASGAASERVAGFARFVEQDSPLEIPDTENPGGGSGSGEILPDGEIVVPTPTDNHPGNGSGWAYGRQKNKWKNRD